jgi:hypothetical protein
MVLLQVRVDALDLHKVVHVVYGQDHALAVTDKVGVFEWYWATSGAYCSTFVIFVLPPG